MKLHVDATQCDADCDLEQLWQSGVQMLLSFSSGFFQGLTFEVRNPRFYGLS
jgi:hypothetical protein